MLNKKDLKDLMDSGLTEEQSSVITGHFSADAKWAKEHIGINREGLIFSYCDLKGKPYIVNNKRFYRIKPHYKPEEKGKPKYLSPSGAGNKPYFSQIDKNLHKKSQDKKIPIIITEGEKKADCLAAHGFFAIGLAGVYGWLDKAAREDELDIPPAQLIEDEREDQDAIGKLTESRLIPELREGIDWESRQIYLAFDSDVVFNRQVRRALQDLAVELKKLGAFPLIIRIPNEINGSKNGADDFIVRHGISAFKIIQEEATPALTSKGAFRFKQDPDRLTKILSTVTIMKDSWRYRPGVGFFTWANSHWESATPEEFEQDFIWFSDCQGWRATAGIDVILRQLKGRLLVREECWNPNNLIVFENGTLDTNTSDFYREHRREDFCTSSLNYSYEIHAECPKWTKFLLSVLEGDEQAVQLIRAFLKWMLTPKSSNKKNEIEKCLDIQGAKGTGKGTFLDILTELVGSDNYAAISNETFNSPTSLSSCLDKKVLIDFDAHGILKNVGIFNRIISNEPVPIRYLYENPIERRLKTVIIRAYNQYTDLPSGSEGVDRRIIAISFKNKKKGNDLTLSDKLRQELPGIFTWAWNMDILEAKQVIMSAGAIENVQQTSSDRFEANNPEYIFLSSIFPQGKRVKAGDLYASYKVWAKDLGYSPKGSRKFYEAIQTIGCKKSPKSNGYFFYDIPKMDDFELGSYLGLGLAFTDSNGSENEPPEFDRTEEPKIGMDDFHLPNREKQVKDAPHLPKHKQRKKENNRGMICPGTTARYIGDNHIELQCTKGGTLDLKVQAICDGIATVKAAEWYVNRQIPVSDLKEKEVWGHGSKILKLKNGDKIKILEHPYHRGYTDRIGVVRSKGFFDIIGDFALVKIDGTAEMITAYFVAIEIAVPKKGDRVRFGNFTGKLEGVGRDKSTLISWEKEEPRFHSPKYPSIRLDQLIAIQ